MSLDLSRIQGLCFDVDGTLSDTDDLFVLKLLHWLSPFRFIFRDKNPQPAARWLVMSTETPGNFLFGLPDRLGIDDKIDALGDFIYRLGLGRSPDPFILIHGVHEMLRQLSNHYPMSIVSARGKRSTQRYLDQFDLQDYFVCVATAQTCAYTKPYPDPVFWAARQMGLPATSCLMIGDTVLDVRAGKAAGAQTAAVLCGFGQVDELTRENPDIILEKTPDLIDILLN
jgi:phosphoglycolate phosphatase-like HAD superfamily hydrolase